MPTSKARAAIDRNIADTYALLNSWAGKLESYAKDNAKWTDQSSHARQSLHADVDRAGNRMSLYLSHGVEYGGILEEGQPPHEIRPKNKKALFWPGADHPVKRVMHPGTKGFPIVEPTLEHYKGRIRNTVLELWG